MDVTVSATPAPDAAPSQRIPGFVDMTPSQRIMALAGRTFAVTDAQGRTIRVRPLKALERMRLKRMAGEDSSNRAFMDDVFTAASVVELGGDPIVFPNSIREVEVIIGRLDDLGLVAIADLNAELEAEDAASPATVAEAKN